MASAITTTLKLKLTKTTVVIVDSTMAEENFRRSVRNVKIEENMVLRGGSIRDTAALEWLYNIGAPKTVHSPREDISLLESGKLDPGGGSSALRGYFRVTSMTDPGVGMIILTTLPRGLAKMLTVAEVRSDRRLGVITLEMNEDGHFFENVKTAKALALELAQP